MGRINEETGVSCTSMFPKRTLGTSCKIEELPFVRGDA